MSNQILLAVNYFEHYITIRLPKINVLNFYFFPSKIVVDLKHGCPIFNVYCFYSSSCFRQDIINRNENKLIYILKMSVFICILTVVLNY